MPDLVSFQPGPPFIQHSVDTIIYHEHLGCVLTLTRRLMSSSNTKNQVFSQSTEPEAMGIGIYFTQFDQ